MFSRKFIISLLFVALAAALGISGIFRADSGQYRTPDLPKEFRVKHSQSQAITMLDFYVTWCRTCQSMAPHVKTMEKEAGEKLHVVHLNLEEPKAEKLGEPYEIAGTPTYILFNAKGKPVYRMDDYISSTVLYGMVRSLTGKIDPLPPPPVGLTDFKKALASKPFVMLVIEPQDCPACKNAQVFLDKVREKFSKKVAVVVLNESDPDVRQYAQQLKFAKLPAYVFMDNQRRPLIQTFGGLWNDYFWGQIALYAKGRVG